MIFWVHENLQIIKEEKENFVAYSFFVGEK
jgi:hypothetical protein